MPGELPAGMDPARVLPGRVSGAGSHPVMAASRATARRGTGGSPAYSGTWMTISSGSWPDGQARDAGLLEQVRGGADQLDVRGQPGGLRPGPGVRGRHARGGGGHDVACVVLAGRTVSLVIVPGRGMTFANDAGPRRNAAAPPSPAAAGNWSRSVPAARMPLMVR